MTLFQKSNKISDFKIKSAEKIFVLSALSNFALMYWKHTSIGLLLLLQWRERHVISSLVGSSISSRLSELPQQRSINFPVYALLHWKQRVDWTQKLNNQLLSFIVLKVEYVSFSATDLSTGTQYWPFVLHVTSNQTLSKHTFKCF